MPQPQKSRVQSAGKTDSQAVLEAVGQSPPAWTLAEEGNEASDAVDHKFRQWELHVIDTIEDGDDKSTKESTNRHSDAHIESKNSYTRSDRASKLTQKGKMEKMSKKKAFLSKKKLSIYRG